MNDPIERQAAIDALIEWYGCEPSDIDAFKNIIEQLPSAQPMRKKGKWTIEDCHAATYRYCCSNCKAHHRARYGFCPSCGARMGGGDS